MAGKYLSRYRPGFIEAANREADGDGPQAGATAAIAT